VNELILVLDAAYLVVAGGKARTTPYRYRLALTVSRATLQLTACRTVSAVQQPAVCIAQTAVGKNRELSLYVPLL
jgi:hypothetical protein